MQRQTCSRFRWNRCFKTYGVLFIFIFSLIYISGHIHTLFVKSNSLIIQIELITVYYFIRVLVMYGIPKVKSYFLHVTWHLITKRIKIQTTFDSSIPANNFCSQAFLLASKTMNIMVIYQNKCFNLNYIPTKVYFLGWEKCLGAVRLMK